MKTQACKAKGRKLQKMVAEALFTVAKKFDPNIQPDDFMSRSMGANGVDVILSPAARKLLGDWAIECKNVEQLNVHKAFEEHFQKYNETALPILVHKKNKQRALCTMSLGLFLNILEFTLYAKALSRK